MKKWLYEGVMDAFFQASGAQRQNSWVFCVKNAADDCNQQINGPKMSFRDSKMGCLEGEFKPAHLWESNVPASSACLEGYSSFQTFSYGDWNPDVKSV